MLTIPFAGLADHHGPPIIQGTGAKAGTVPTDLEQSTGIERFELLSRMQGEDPFSNKPLEVNHMGTLDNPIKVWSLVRRLLVFVLLSLPCADIGLGDDVGAGPPGRMHWIPG